MLKPFIPQSPDPFLQTGDDMSLAKFGHLNELVKEINTLTPSNPVTSVTATAPCVSSGGTTPAISIPQANGTTDGYCSASDFANFEGKQDAITLTTTGSGAATLVGSTLNVPTPAASPLLTTTVTYTGAEIIAGGKTILAAPGAGKYYMIHSCTIKFKDATVPFNTTDPYSFQLAAGSGLQVLNLPSGTTESIWGYASGPCFENGALSIGPHVGSQPTAGDGNLVFDITYELKDF